MPIATNPDTGEALFLNPQGQWEPAKLATNPNTGKRAAFDGTQWVEVGPAQGSDSSSNGQNGLLEQIVGELKNIGRGALGAVETGASLASGIIAEPVAGVAGIAKAITSGPEEAAKSIEGIREGLTFEPKSEVGLQQMNAIGQVLEPVGKAFKASEKFLGDKTFEITGSPALAAAAASIPTALTEAVGFKVGKARGLRKAGVDKKGIAKALDEAVETPEQLKTIASGVYTEIDELGVTVKPEAFNRLIEKIEVQSVKRGLDKKLTPDAQGLIDRLKEEASSGAPITVTKMDTLRKIAEIPAGSLKRTEKALGVNAIDNIDDFLDNAQSTALNIPEGVTANVGKRYEVARNLWGRVRKSEEIGKLLEDADLQATGFDAGLRIAARKLLKSEKRIKFFTEGERELIKSIEGGGPGIAGLTANFISGTGRLGVDFSKGGGGFLGPAAGTGAAVAAISTGNPSILAIPAIGLVSRLLGEKLVKGKALFADKVIRAGGDGNKIVKAYVENVPKGLRKSEELAELLRNPRIELANLPDSKLVRDAVADAVRQRSLLTAAGTGAAVAGQGPSVEVVDVVPGPILQEEAR